MQTIPMTIAGRDYVAITAEDYRRLTAAERAPAAGLAGRDAIAYARQVLTADRLKAARKQAGLTQAQIAHALGISQPTVAGHERRGGNTCGESLIGRWMDACGLPADWEPEDDQVG
ncbi:MAG: helix-turn-helix domain-containing protein [Planctomycetota bacterium]